MLWWTGAIFWIVVGAVAIIAASMYAIGRIKQAITRAVCNIEDTRK